LRPLRVRVNGTDVVEIGVPFAHINRHYTDGQTERLEIWDWL